MLHHLLLRPETTFTRAILQSGVVSVIAPVPPSGFDTVWRKLLDHYQAKTVDDMRKVPANELVKVALENGARHQPLVDSVICEDPIRKYKEQGAYGSLEALIIGDCADEGTIWSHQGDIKELYKSYEDQVPANLLDRFYQLYPSDLFDKDPTLAQKMVDELVGEAKFLCPIDRTANAIAKLRPEAQLYRYKVSRTVEATRSWNMGAHHGIDIFFTFMSDKLTEEERETSERLCSDWLKFAYEEKLDETSDWNRYDLNKPTMLVYGEQTAMADATTDRASSICQFWEEVETASVQNR
jgi:carboxylesterase type B